MTRLDELRTESAQAESRSRSPRLVPARGIGAQASARRVAACATGAAGGAYQSRSAKAKIEEIENAIALLTEQTASLAAQLRQEKRRSSAATRRPGRHSSAGARASQRARAGTGHGPRRARRDGNRVKEVEHERMTAEQRLGPLRDRTNDVRLKEQELA